MISEERTAAYSVNLALLIRDVRRDLPCPVLPWVVVQMGVEGTEPSPSIERFKQAQAAVTELDEFRSNGRLVRSDQFWAQDAAAVFRRGWKENLEEWNQFGSDYPYHYLVSGRTMIGIGRAMAEAVWELRPH